MATTDTRSGFRLPWSSDRNHDTTEVDAPAAAAGEAVAEAAPVEAAAWPSTDVRRDAEPPITETTAPVAEESVMLDLQPAPAQPVTAPRKPTKLMADLSAAIRATAESARDQALVQVEADAGQVVETIRSGSKDGEAALRARSDEDIAGIKEWSRAEIARIKEETERRIDARKLGLDEELAAHAAAIEQRVGAVESTVAAYRSEMDAYAERLGREDDPARLATLAELMPEPPALANLADLSDAALEIDPLGVPGFPADVEAVTEPEPEVMAEAEPEAVVETLPEPDAIVEPELVAEAMVEPEAIVEPEAMVEPEAETPTGTDDDFPADVIAARLAGFAVAADSADADPVAPGTGEYTFGTADPVASPDPVPAYASWGETEGAWSSVRTAAVATAQAAVDDAPAAGTDEADQVDRGAIMAALEAAAEAVEDADPDPEAAGPTTDGGELDGAFADRLASLLPVADDGAAVDEQQTTQVVVSGLVSVASIASFKRHLGRLAGVRGVAVSSGPEGEFVFNVTHRSDASFRDGIATLPGFAARVTSVADGVVQVTARDPEAEG